MIYKLNIPPVAFLALEYREGIDYKMPGLVSRGMITSPKLTGWPCEAFDNEVWLRASGELTPIL